MRKAVRKSITYRKMGTININKFITDCDLSNIKLSEVEDMVNAFNNQLKNALNDNAPEITKQVTVRKKYHGSHKKLGKRRELFEEEKPSGRSTEEMTNGKH